MTDRLYRMFADLAICLLVASCGGAGEDRGMCTAFGPSQSGYQGCDNAVLNLAVHPCHAQVESRCAAAPVASTCAADTMASCATDYYLREYAAESLPACDPSKPIVSIDKELNLSLYRYSNISDSSTVRHTQGLQRYYAPHRLTMKTGTVATPERLRFAIAGTEAEVYQAVEQALRQAGVSPTTDELTPEEQSIVDRAIGDVMFAPTKAFFARHSVPAEPKVNVVIIDQILSPGMVSMMQLKGTIVGLGLSSTLIARLQTEDPENASLNTMLQVNGDFTPTLFVGHNDIERLAGNYDLVVAHEMGHALGLPHVEDTGNLMEQGGSLTCRHWLSQAQIDLMGPFADVVTPEDAMARILVGKRKVLERVLELRRTNRPAN